MGFKEDGSIELLSFDNASGNKVKTKFYVVVFLDYERFAFTVLSRESYHEVLTNDKINYVHALGADYFANMDTYLIDKTTGKFYYLDEKVGVFQVYNPIAWEVNETFYAMDYLGWGGNTPASVGLKSFKINNYKQLVIETHLKGETFTEPWADRYGNIYYKNNNSTYVLSKNNRLNLVPSDNNKQLQIGFNGIMYFEEYLGMDHSHTTSQYYDEEGTLSDTNFVPQGLYKTDYIIRTQLPILHFSEDTFYWYNDYIYWVHFTNTDKTQYELFSYPSESKESITVGGDYLFWLDNTVIQTLHLSTKDAGTLPIKNGEDTVFVEKLIGGGDGKVYFSGKDQSLSKIEGSINTDLSYTFKSSPYTNDQSSIIYISPIN